MPADGGNAADPIPSRHFFQTASITPEDRAEGVGKIVRIANQHKLTSAGIFSSSESVEGVFNSRGLSDWHTQTSAEISVTMLAKDSSGWQKANSPDVRNLDPVVLAEAAARKAVESAAPRELPAGKYTVILEPAAVLDIVGFMFWDFGGQAILDERSFLNNRIGTRLFGENINIYDEVGHPLQSGSPYDGEGMRRATCPTGGEWCGEAFGLRTCDGGKDEEVGVCLESRPGSNRPAMVSFCRMKWARCPSTLFSAIRTIHKRPNT